MKPELNARIPLRVLIVEDSEDDTLLLLRELRRGDYEPIHERVDTREAMQQALTEGGPWDVVLSDWRMPRFSGTGALAMSREMDPETPFIIVSGKVGEETAVEAMKAGAHDYVMKGNLTRLCATVKRGLEEAEARRERERAKEERDRLFEFSLDLLGVASLDGYFKRVNPAFEETLGYSSAELLAKPFIEFVHPEDRAATMSELRGLCGGVRTAYFENRYLHKDGAQVWLSWKAVPVVEEDLIYATARDVTERKQAEEELRRREAILRAVAFAAQRFLKKAASWEESIEEVLERLGRAAEVSRAYIFENYRGEDGELWGTQRYEWVATGVSSQMDNPLMQAIPYRAAGFGRWGELLSRGEPIHGHTREFPEEARPELREQDILSMVIVPIFVEEEWWGFIGFDECFTEREWSAAEIDALKAAAGTLGAAIGRTRAERALRESEERTRTVLANAPVVLFALDREGVFTLAEGRGLEAMGLQAEQGVGRSILDIYRHEPESLAHIRRALAGEEFTSVDDLAGLGRVFEVRWSSMRDGSGTVTGVIGVATDITERKKAGEALAQSEERYRAVVEQAAEGIFLFDTATGDILESNAAVQELLGYTAGEFLSMKLYDFIAHDRESIDSNIRLILDEGNRFVGERQYCCKDGSLVDVEVSASPISYGGREVICSVIRDVTERKRAERALRESQRALTTLMSNLPGIAYRCRNDPDWTMELVSEGCLELTGYPPGDLIDNRRRSYGDLIHPDDQEEVWESVQAALRERRTFQFNYRITTASGATRWVWEQGRGVFSPEGTLLALEGFITDITERKRARDALAQSEERYRTVVEQATEGIFLCDAATGEVLESNTAFRELLGYTAGELRGIKIHDLVDADRESIDTNTRLILDEGSRFLGQRRYRRKDGSLVDVEATASMISYGGRKVICDVIRDVTERVEAFRLLEERVTALAGISASLTVGQTMEATLDALAARVIQNTAAVACAVVLLNAQTGLPRTAGSHGLPEGYTAGLQAAYEAGLRSRALEVFRTRRPMLLRDARQSTLNNPLFSPIHRFLREVRWETIYSVPLVSRGWALGAFNLYYLAEHEPGEDEKVFLGAVADQTAVAVENARLFAEARGKAALEERQRLARELHDSVSQALYGIVLGADAARTLLGRDPTRVAEPLEYVLSLAKAGLAEMRALIFELRPESLQTEGLVAALGELAEALRARHEIPVHATLCDEPDLSLETKEALYRIAQEALHNTVKHARASKVNLRLERGARDIALEVSDDGAGFDPGGSFPGHLGLISMRERAERLGGTLRVESAPGEGARIRARIPPGT